MINSSAYYNFQDSIYEKRTIIVECCFKYGRLTDNDSFAKWMMVYHDIRKLQKGIMALYKEVENADLSNRESKNLKAQITISFNEASALWEKMFDGITGFLN